jgi:hypothetical protein
MLLVVHFRAPKPKPQHQNANHIPPQTHHTIFGGQHYLTRLKTTKSAATCARALSGCVQMASREVSAARLRQEIAQARARP